MIFHQLTLINIYGKCLRKGGNPNAVGSAVFSESLYNGFGLEESFNTKHLLRRKTREEDYIVYITGLILHELLLKQWETNITRVLSRLRLKWLTVRLGSVFSEFGPWQEKHTKSIATGTTASDPFADYEAPKLQFYSFFWCRLFVDMIIWCVRKHVDEQWHTMAQRYGANVTQVLTFDWVSPWTCILVEEEIMYRVKWSG